MMKNGRLACARGFIVGSGERRRQRGAQRVELVRQGGDIHD
jgi:hypothetical protein